ncbi:hypothetical protein [Sphingobium amiense]|uniref:hypothetical protein n=1 Tax=Sphingobium amiense TaxID=135719 RepID=UPI000A48A862|nr:hypothetical protein [Sphingobium amiense]
MLNIFKRKEPVISLAEHERIVGEKARQHAIDTARWGALMKEAGQRLEEVRKDRDGLLPDALKYRAKLIRDREGATQRRQSKTMSMRASD